MKEITKKGYAKINLTLDVVGKRDDGYHLLEMVMQSISLYDTVHIQVEDGGQIQLFCNDSSLPCDESNTVYRAAEAFRKRFRIPHGLSFTIEKNIPSQAGLAGGSADAAAALTGLNDLFQTGLSMEELCELGLAIGADVPFCLWGGTMLAHGIGEKLAILPPLPSCYLVVCKPPFDISTKEAYEKIDQALFLAHPGTKAMETALKNKDLPDAAKHLFNVFEHALAMTEIYQIKGALKKSGSLGSCMTGSGSAVYGIFSTKEQAEQGVALLKKNYEEVFLCQPTVLGVE